jgi:hypothetical protein
MLALFINWLKKDKNKEIKDILLKEYLNPKNQKKAIKEAAKKSAEDQNEILKKYRQLLKQS